ncbi:unnamed protein product [Schistocephalus solidus]|uniref:Transmembrane protein n=1 Tax=Schistocephalus solidus TaxID=70667 RepID=A0A183TJE7_SCHSO|nr:unnamed protein product [Schistocephalus solidus]
MPPSPPHSSLKPTITTAAAALPVCPHFSLPLASSVPSQPSFAPCASASCLHRHSGIDLPNTHASEMNCDAVSTAAMSAVVTAVAETSPLGCQAGNTANSKRRPPKSSAGSRRRANGNLHHRSTLERCTSTLTEIPVTDGISHTNFCFYLGEHQSQIFYGGLNINRVDGLPPLEPIHVELGKPIPIDLREDLYSEHPATPCLAVPMHIFRRFRNCRSSHSHIKRHTDSSVLSLSEPCHSGVDLSHLSTQTYENGVQSEYKSSDYTSLSAQHPLPSLHRSTTALISLRVYFPVQFMNSANMLQAVTGSRKRVHLYPARLLSLSLSLALASACVYVCVSTGCSGGNLYRCCSAARGDVGLAYLLAGLCDRVLPVLQACWLCTSLLPSASSNSPLLLCTLLPLAVCCRLRSDRATVENLLFYSNASSVFGWKIPRLLSPAIPGVVVTAFEEGPGLAGGVAPYSGHLSSTDEARERRDPRAGCGSGCALAAVHLPLHLPPRFSNSPPLSQNALATIPSPSSASRPDMDWQSRAQTDLPARSPSSPPACRGLVC